MRPTRALLLTASLLALVAWVPDVHGALTEPATAATAASSTDSTGDAGAGAAFSEALAGAGQEEAESVIKRQGPRLLAVETYNGDEPLPSHLDHIERRELQKLDTTCDKSNLLISHRLVTTDGYFPTYNLTIVNNCRWSLKTPLVLDNCGLGGFARWSVSSQSPIKWYRGTPFSPYDRYGPFSCALKLNRGPKGTLQMTPGEAVTYQYQWVWPFRFCARELHWVNGDDYVMRSESECVPPPLFK